MKKSKLSAEIILNKKFQTELAGYSASEVDAYLDQIIEDFKFYENASAEFQNLINNKVALINDKEEEIQKLKFEIYSLKETLDKTEKATNVELLNELQKYREEILTLSKKIDNKK